VGLAEGTHLPLLSTTDAGYSPYEYPERVDRRGYFYIATSRPGFPVYYVVADSTLYDSYWFNATGDYFGTVGAAERGDQPGDVHWTVVAALFADAVERRSMTGVYGSGAVAELRGDAEAFRAKPFTRPVATINGVDLFIYGGVGPAPGTMFETGAAKGIGSITVPMAPHEVQIDVHKPGGEVHRCRGRADSIGNFTCPGAPLVFDEPGVYRVFTRFWEGDARGDCAGSRDGWYDVYAVDKDSPYRVRFDESMPRTVDVDAPFAVRGRVDPPLARGRAHYSIVTPGILMDEGEVPLANGAFAIPFLAGQFLAEFHNLHGHPFGKLPAHMAWRKAPFVINALFRGYTKTWLTDTVEIAVFVEGEDAAGAPATAGGKVILRGSRVVLPQPFTGRRVATHE
ncbi:hypothetical protein LDC_1799, partial [sediment metagenome]